MEKLAVVAQSWKEKQAMNSKSVLLKQACQSVAKVELTGVAPLGAVSH